MKIFLSLLTLFFITTTLPALAQKRNDYGRHYGPYFGVHGGQAQDIGKGAEKMTGPTYGAQIGYRWWYAALEAGYSTYQFEAEKGQANRYFIEKANTDAYAIDLTARFFLLRYLHLAVGISSASAKNDFYLTNIDNDPSQTLTIKGDDSYGGAFYQVGLTLPLTKSLDAWLLYENKKWTTDTVDTTSGRLDYTTISFHTYTAHLVYYFR